MVEYHASLSAEASAFLSGEHRLYIDGCWVEPMKEGVLHVQDPAKGSEISRVAEGRAADIDRAVIAARRAFENGPWHAMKPSGRASIMLALADLIDRQAQVLAEIETMETGKPLAFALGSVRSAANMLRYYAGWASNLGGREVPLSSAGEWHAYTRREPVGVVGQVIPWNFPLSMAVWKIAPVLATGCTSVLKPAEQTPLGALRLAALFEEAGVPAGVLNVVPGYGGDAGARLAAHPDVDKIAFTGSAETGRSIVQAALGNLKRVTLELGGKSPVIVLPDADMERAVPGAANAIFFNSGQVCAAGSRLFVHRKVFDNFVADVAVQGAKMKMGHGLDESSRVGPLISARQRARVQSMIEQGLAEGATIVGETAPIPDGKGYFVAPHVLADTNPDMSVIRDEIFGPVVCAIPFGDEDIDAIAKAANHTSYGLAASIWTQNLSAAHRLSNRIRSGNVAVNSHAIADVELPFGGYKESGWGRERGSEVLNHYTETKSVAIRLD
ncbi:aldehyde dehydrogenase family protein [Sphingobium sp. V4]|uniref:aldehyde dehydrogenase family protein n=1 Tax=Sphingobium sp. V4 TaxID=3038927 RepID=UPI0025582250|nr:aldehyde dehydrogenase family protein [Sphingobium sp. V4]WIW89494.1 aldehyde dehydrogenase family protein [Sphingobium sp. V4]